MEKKLIGNWYSSSKNRIYSELQFYKDTLVIYDSSGKTTLKWNLDEGKIYTSHLNQSGPIYDYDLKSINLKLVRNDTIELPKFTKAKNAYDFFQKILNMQIDLPIKDSELIEIGFLEHLNFNIYAGYNNKELVVKTDLTPDLNNLESEVTEFKEKSRDELKRLLRFNLIADKNISEFQMDSIKNRLKTTSIEQIFRTYKNKQTDYKNNLNWFGQKE
ncbi:hypothetical protein [Bizionia sp.]|uniref:hypothetical protein n=1 Tax=Bizionia sp. TaxID=1954480 RepID=UPI003A8E1865